jgi:glutathione S-transferase
MPPAPQNATSFGALAATRRRVGPQGDAALVQNVDIKGARKKTLARAALTISSRNYSSWSLRGWLICKFAGLDFEVVKAPLDDAAARAELLLLAPSFLIPCLAYEGLKIWDTLAIAEFLNETLPDANLLPEGREHRARCRSISGEMHSGFANLRAALPMNLKAHHPGFKVWAGAQTDIDRVTLIWREQLAASGGPFLFGKAPSLADAMYAPVCTRFVTYDVALDPVSAAYRDRMVALPEMKAWKAEALTEPDEVEELEVEF